MTTETETVEDVLAEMRSYWPHEKIFGDVADDWAARIAAAHAREEKDATTVRQALRDVLDSLGALSNPHELEGHGFFEQEIKHILKCADSDAAMGEPVREVEG